MTTVRQGDRGYLDGAALVWAEATAAREGEDDVAPLEVARPIIARVLDQPGAVLVVALDDDGQVEAFAVAAPAAPGDGTVAEVEYVGVRPGRWGGGLATAVLRSLRAELAAVGFTGAQLMVYVSNERAAGLYQRLGWRPAGNPRPHPRTGKPEQRYQLALGDEPGLSPRPPGRRGTGAGPG